MVALFEYPFLYTLICVVVFRWLNGIFKGEQDTLMKSKAGVITTWIEKYKTGIKLDKDRLSFVEFPIEVKDVRISKLYRLYHKIFKLKYVEKFPFSATLLVWTTDDWHANGTLRHLSDMFLIFFITVQVVGVWQALLLALIAWIARAIGFHESYTFTKKELG